MSPEEIQALLAQHQLRIGWAWESVGCSCGWDEDQEKWHHQTFNEHLAAVFAKAATS